VQNQFTDARSILCDAKHPLKEEYIWRRKLGEGNGRSALLACTAIRHPIAGFRLRLRGGMARDPGIHRNRYWYAVAFGLGGECTRARIQLAWCSLESGSECRRLRHQRAGVPAVAPAAERKIRNRAGAEGGTDRHKDQREVDPSERRGCQKAPHEQMVLPMAIACKEPSCVTNRVQRVVRKKSYAKSCRREVHHRLAAS
jgi:hypothetical protein